MNWRAIASVSRTNLRRQRGSLGVLVLLVALVSGVVLTGVSAARRTATVLDRYLAATDQADLGAFVMGLPAADAPAFFREIPGVRDAASIDSFLAEPTAAPDNHDFVIVSSPDGRFGTEIDRVLVREGRMPAPNRADEVALNRPAAEALGLGVGDTLGARTMSPATFERLVTGRGGPELDGPRLHPMIVGLIDYGEDLQGSAHQSAPLALASPAFSRRYGGEVAVGGSTTAIKTSDPGTADRVRTALAAFPQSGVSTAEEQWVDTTRSAIDVLTIGLLIFAGIALVAGAIAVGQTISRQVSSDSGARVVTRAVGLTRPERVASVVAPVLGAVTVGTLLGVLVAIACSGQFPMAIARAAEPDPGLRIDPVTLAGGAAALAALLCAWTVFGAHRADRRAFDLASSPTRRNLPAILGVGSRVPSRLGMRLALDRDRGRSNLPTRSALFGTVAATVGVVAVVVFASSLDTALHTPSAFGWTWSSRPDIGSDADPQAVLDRLATDDDLASVGAVFKGEADIEDLTVPLQAFVAVEGSLAPPVLDGRLPTSRSEVALGSSTLDATGHSTGDTIDLGLAGRPAHPFTVVGEVVGNQLTDTPDLGKVAIVTPEAAAELAGVEGTAGLLDSSFSGNVLLTYRDGVTGRSIEPRLERDQQLSFVTYSRPTAPGRLLNIEAMRSLLTGIAIFLGAIGTLAVVHLLVVSTRRRTRDFGTLRALGLVKSQLRSTIWFQGLTILLVGLVVGLPVGVALGRWAWRAALSGVGMIATPATPLLGLASLVAVAVVVTSLASWLPGVWASRACPAVLLRAE